MAVDTSTVILRNGMQETSLNGSSCEQDVVHLDSKYLEVWGFSLSDLYRLAFRFYKEKEGKAVHLNYEQKCLLIAYTQQVAHGSLVPDKGGEVGVLDVVGRDRRFAWAKLGNMSKESAMVSFIETLDISCPLFRPYIEAHKQDLEIKERKRKEDEERQRQLEELKRKEEEELKEHEEKRRQIKEALNQQTYVQFKAYAEQQYPGNPDEQAVLIRQLQEQHYKQYMLQLQQQQHLSGEAETLKAWEAPPKPEPEAEDHEEEEETLALAPASMWTRKDIVDFKTSIRQEGKDAVLKVGHGETVTVRVPTHPEGSCIFWEFATDGYDIGFGLYFEWSEPQDQQVSVHISESEDEDDEDDEDTAIPALDLEGGSLAKAVVDDPSRPPVSIIIPVYRRDCQEEVYAGSHPYPGRGVYLLKFDNSYSLWRSKTLYYRVYYTR